jgi:hypothetical protein
MKDGIGAPADPIRLTLSVKGATAACFALCETAVDSILGPNAIGQVRELKGGVYEITLLRPITAGAVTTIAYLDGSFVFYVAHPGNVNADGVTAITDLLKLIDYLNGVESAPHGRYSTDIDHSGAFTAADVTQLIAVLSGASFSQDWLGTRRPLNTSCP